MFPIRNVSPSLPLFIVPLMMEFTWKIMSFLLMIIHEARVPMSTSDRAFCMEVWDWGSLGIGVQVWERVLPVASQQFRGALGLTDKDEQLWLPEEIYGNWLNNSSVALEYQNCNLYRWWTFSQLSNENKVAATCQKASIWLKSSCCSLSPNGRQVAGSRLSWKLLGFLF